VPARRPEWDCGKCQLNTRWSDFGCSGDCEIPVGTCVTLDVSADVNKLVVKGRLTWDTSKDGLTLKADSIWITDCGIFEIGSLDAPMMNDATIYLKSAGGFYSGFGSDAQFGSESMPGRATVEIHGRPLKHPWTLLTKTVQSGDDQIEVEHDVSDWKVGDKVTVGITGKKYRTTESFRIRSISGQVIFLDGSFQNPRLGRQDRRLQAEVMNTSRNILVTGDDFNAARHGNHMLFNSYARVSYTRVEKCGQKNVKGRYCMHYHQVRDCPECLLLGNVAEDGSQKGFTIHGSHQIQVRECIAHKVLGAGFYIEDGNELYNTFAYNVNICHEKDGCILRGATVHSRADEAEQAGMWFQSATNHIMYNRVGNHKHAIFFDGAIAGSGRGFAAGKVCNAHDEYGIVRGNVSHSCNLFGIYFHTMWPRKVRRSIASNGMVEDMEDCKAGRWCSCDALKPDGSDNGAVAVIEDSLDYSNNWSGGYGYGDHQWKGFHVINNLHGIYWKQTKPMADGRIGHVIDSKFETVNDDREIQDVVGGGYGVVGIFQPGGWGAFHVHNTVFHGNFGDEIMANHHCQVGGNTGALCTPVIDLEGISWDDNWSLSFGWSSEGFVKKLPIWTSTDNSLEKNWPVTSLASGEQTHLLALNGCDTTSDKKYGGGIICNKAVRRLQIWSPDQGSPTISPLSYNANETNLEWMRGGNPKTGYGAVVVAGEKYRLKLNSLEKVVLEFSDLCYNDELTLEIEYHGRVETCRLSSNHSRNWMTTDGPVFDGPQNPNKVHPGACTQQLDMLSSHSLII